MPAGTLHENGRSQAVACELAAAPLCLLASQDSPGPYIGPPSSLSALRSEDEDDDAVLLLGAAAPVASHVVRG